MKSLKSMRGDEPVGSSLLVHHPSVQRFHGITTCTLEVEKGNDNLTAGQGTSACGTASHCALIGGIESNRTLFSGFCI